VLWRRDEELVCALLAAHNRRDTTVRAVRQLAASANHAGLRVGVVAVDDGSIDGTGDALRGMRDIDVTVVDGDGNWYWARSMATAESLAMSRADSHSKGWLLWLNDDTTLDIDAIERLIEASRSAPDRIIVGTTRDPDTSVSTYGGLVRSGPHPLAYALVEPPETGTREIASFNGNIVLVPLSVAARLGGIDGAYGHAAADIDYGFRAAAAGTPALLPTGTFGTCARNAAPPQERSLVAWRRFVSVKGGGHPGSSARFLKKAAPVAWPFWFLATYGLWWLRRI